MNIDVHTLINIEGLMTYSPKLNESLSFCFPDLDCGEAKKLFSVFKSIREISQNNAFVYGRIEMMFDLPRKLFKKYSTDTAVEETMRKFFEEFAKQLKGKVLPKEVGSRTKNWFVLFDFKHPVDDIRWEFTGAFSSKDKFLISGDRIVNDLKALQLAEYEISC